MPQTAEQVLEKIQGTTSEPEIEQGEVENFLNDTPDNSNPNAEVTPKDSSHSQSSPDAAETFRSLADLNEGASSHGFKLNATEKQRVKIAVKKGFTSDEQIDAYLKETGKKTGTKEKELKTEGDKIDEPEVNNEDTTTDDNDNLDDDGELDIDSKLLKVIGPHLDKADSIEDAVTAVKNLQYHASRASEFVNKAKSVGLDSPEKVEQAVNTLNNIDTFISESLKTSEGLQGLYEHFKIPMPDGIGRGAPAKPVVPGDGSNTQNQADLDSILNKFEDDGFVNAATFKSIIPALTSQIRSELDKEYSSGREEIQQLKEFVQKQVKQTEKTQAYQAAFQDVREIADKFARFDPSVKLSADPVTIWKESVGPDNRFKKNPHPELGKLQKLLKMRNSAIKQIRASHAELGLENGPVDVLAYLSKQLVTSGSLEQLADKARKTGVQNLASQLAQRLQPGIRDKRTPGSNTSFKVPQTEEDVKNLSDAHRKLFLKKLRLGQLRVGT